MASKTPETYRFEIASDVVVRVTSPRGEYEVRLSTGRGPSCTCPGFRWRGACKHAGLVASYLAAVVDSYTPTKRGGQAGVAPLR